MNFLPRCAPLALLLFATPLLAQSPEDAPAKAPPAATPSPKDTSAPAKADPLSPGSHAGVGASAIPSGNPIDALSEDDLDKVLPILKSHYFQPGALSDTEIKRATVQGLIERLKPKISLATASEAGGSVASPFKSEILENKVGYLRLGSIGNENLTQLDIALKQFGEKELPAVILDLRATPSGAGFDLAAEVCRRFCPKGKILFTVRQPGAKDQIFTSKDDPLTHAVLVVLTGSTTAGSGEIVAGVLRNIARAMVVGQTTRGEAAGFEDVPLSGTTVLRVPVAEFVLPGESEVISSGLKPDLAVDVSPETSAEVLKAELEKGVAPLVLESERPRLNEAALVAGSNPDLDAMIAAQHHRGDPAKGPLHDAALQRAMDFITSIAIYKKGLRGQ